MQKQLFIKLATIAVITLLLLIPINLVSDKIYERFRFKEEAKASIAESWTRQQAIIGPFIVIPYTQTLTYKEWDNNSRSNIEKTTIDHKLSFIPPEKLNISGATDDEIRRRGIYEIPVYTADLRFEGEYDLSQLMQRIQDLKSLEGEITLEQPFMVLSVTDPRGINQVPELVWQGQTQAFLPGTNVGDTSNGIHALLPELSSLAKDQIPFSLQLSLRGIESISIIPVGKSSQIHLASNWPHPKFIGRFLPGSYDISEEGYVAQWQLTSFATNIEENLNQCAVRHCEELYETSFGVEHIEAVDIYLQSERSLKYALLFILLTFLTFFIIEVKNGLAIHAIQYVLVGAAIAIFYLLLFALSEHLSFLLAYILASVSCVAVVGVYMSRVIGGARKASLFSFCLWLLYATLYVIVSAEDYALLMGAILTFSLLSLLMLATRKVDWFSVMGEFESMAKSTARNTDLNHSSLAGGAK